MQMLFKGTVPTKDALPKKGNRIGDLWNIAGEQSSWVWTAPAGGSVLTWVDPRKKKRDISMAKQKQYSVADQFSDDEMEQLKRYGEALGGVTPFDEEVEKRLAYHEANYAKQRAAETGGSLELGPSEIE